MGEDGPDVVNDFDTWANVSARLTERSDEEHARILGELGIAEVWDNADAAWSKALAGEILDMRFDRVQQYGAICARELAARSREDDVTTQRDFRHRATFGDREDEPSSTRQVRQIGGTPFSDDPLDREPTRKLRSAELKAHLETITEVSRGVWPTGDNGVADDAQSEQAKTQTRDSSAALHEQVEAALAAADWPIERYARYRAELTAGLEAEAKVNARHGLPSEVAQRHVATAWRARLSADAELDDKVEALVAEYLAELRSGE